MRKGIVEQPGSLTMAFDSATIILAASRGDWGYAAAYKVLEDVGWQYNFVYVAPGENGVPGVVLVVNGNEWWIGVTGTDNTDQLINEASGYFPTGRSDDGYLVNSEFNRLSKRIVGWIVSLGKDAPLHLHISGISLGGAIAVCLAREANRVLSIQTIDVVTFGCPKVGSRDYYSSFVRTAWTAYQNKNDPVPYLPTLPIVSPGLSFLFKQVFNGNSRLYSVAPVVTVLEGEGIISHKPFPVIDLALLGVLLDKLGGESSAVNRLGHPLTNYRYQIGLVIEREVYLGNELRLQADPPLPPLPPTAPAVNTFPGGFTFTPVPNPMYVVSVQPVPLRCLPRKFKCGRFWGVLWMGRFVIVSKNRWRAKAAADYLATFLKRLQFAKEYLADNFAASFAEYVTFSSEINGGFDPLLPIS